MAKILNFKKHQLYRHAIPSSVFYFITFEKSMHFQKTHHNWVNFKVVFTGQNKEMCKKMKKKITDLQLFHLFKINFHCFRKSSLFLSIHTCTVITAFNVSTILNCFLLNLMLPIFLMLLQSQYQYHK